MMITKPNLMKTLKEILFFGTHIKSQKDFDKIKKKREKVLVFIALAIPGTPSAMNPQFGVCSVENE